MIHYTCDLCGARLDGLDQRFVVKIEVYAAAEERAHAHVDELDEGDDDLEELTEQLAHSDPPRADEANYQGLRFDLCPRCQRRYLSDPLFRAAKKRMDFSEN